MGIGTANFDVEIPAEHHHLSEARVESAAWLRTQLRGRDGIDATVADAAVVLTELAANVIDHSASDWIRLRIDVDPAAVTIEVAGAGPVAAVPDVAMWGILEEGDRGRGLRIVRAICDRVEVSGDDEVTTVRALLALS